MRLMRRRGRPDTCYLFHIILLAAVVARYFAAREAHHAFFGDLIAGKQVGRESA